MRKIIQYLILDKDQLDRNWKFFSNLSLNEQVRLNTRQFNQNGYPVELCTKNVLKHSMISIVRWTCASSQSNCCIVECVAEFVQELVRFSAGRCKQFN